MQSLNGHCGTVPFCAITRDMKDAHAWVGPSLETDALPYVRSVSEILQICVTSILTEIA